AIVPDAAAVAWKASAVPAPSESSCASTAWSPTRGDVVAAVPTGPSARTTSAAAAASALPRYRRFPRSFLARRLDVRLGRDPRRSTRHSAPPSRSARRNQTSCAVRRNRRGCRQECLAHDAQHALARPLHHRHETSELESRELDPPRRAHGREAEVGEKVAREDRLVHLEALVRVVTGAVAIRERLQGARALVAGVADRGQEERLHHPRARRRDEVGARDEHGVLARRARGQLGGPREEVARAVLHRAEQAAVVVVIDRPPRAPLLLRAADPLALVGAAARRRLPEDALVADGRSRPERRTGEPDDARHPTGPMRSTITSTRRGGRSAIRRR